MLSWRTQVVLKGMSAAKVRAVLAVGLLLAASVSLLAQANLGRILGTVTDQTGAPVPNATVTIIDTDRGVERTVTTDEAGAYVAPSLVPGNKRVRAELKGFKVVEQTNITLQVAQDLREDLVLAGRRHQREDRSHRRRAYAGHHQRHARWNARQHRHQRPSLERPQLRKPPRSAPRRYQGPRQRRLEPEQQRRTSSRQLLHGGRHR